MFNGKAGDTGDLGLISGLGRSLGEGNGNSFQYSYPGNPMDRRSLAGYNPWGHKRVRHDLGTKQQEKFEKKSQ